MPDRAAVGRRNQAAGRAEEAAVAHLYALAGCVVYRLTDHGQRRGTKGVRYATNSPGVPDLEIFHAGRGVRWVHEVKVGGAKLTTDQKVYRDLCIRVGLHYASGDRDTARAWLILMGIIRDTPDGVTIDRVYPDQGRIVTRRAKR